MFNPFHVRQKENCRQVELNIKKQWILTEIATPGRMSLSSAMSKTHFFSTEKNNQKLNFCQGFCSLAIED